MQVHFIDSHDVTAFGDWFAVLRATDEERWPDMAGWDYDTAKAMADLEGAMSFLCLAATDPSGATVGIGALQVPNWENRHQVMLDVRVLPGHRRQHIGSAIVEEVERWALAAGRSVIHGESQIPVTALASDGSAPFAEHLGFIPVQAANRRHLALPIDPAAIAPLREEVAAATVGYRCRAFTTPWPKQYMEDQFELQRRMSTDAPSGDPQNEEQVWNAERVQEVDDLMVAQGIVKMAAVAEHLASGRLVAFTELAIPVSRQTEAWQWATLVLGEHRGHRLGLAVKLANLDYLSATFPTVRYIVTGNAAENAPMIAVNEMLGFKVAANEMLWEKHVAPTQ